MVVWRRDSVLDKNRQINKEPRKLFAKEAFKTGSVKRRYGRIVRRICFPKFVTIHDIPHPLLFQYQMSCVVPYLYTLYEPFSRLATQRDGGS